MSSPSATVACRRRRPLAVEMESSPAASGRVAHVQAHEKRQELGAEAVAERRGERRVVAAGRDRQVPLPDVRAGVAQLRILASAPPQPLASGPP